MKSERILPATFFVAMALAFWRAQTPASGIGWPRPHRFAGVAVVWTLLAVIAAAAPGLAAAFGAGLCVALALGPAVDKGATSGLAAFKPEANILRSAKPAAATTGGGLTLPQPGTGPYAAAPPTSIDPLSNAIAGLQGLLKLGGNQP